MSFSERLYEQLTDDEDGSACIDIDEAACREAPASFALILVSHFLTKLGDALISPKTTLAWVCGVVGAPAFVAGILVPIRESGSLIPQLFVGGVIRGLPVRKWVWVAGSVAQGLAVLSIGAVVVTLEGAAAGASIIGLIVLFSFARGCCSVASKDVLGKTIPKRKRGQLTGWSASAAGLVSIAVAAFLILRPDQGDGAALYGGLIAAAGALWLVAAAVFSRLDETPGETGGSRSAAEALARLRLLATDMPFRRFVIARTLMLCTALSAPFYIALAQERIGSPGYLLGLFVAAGGLASLLSGPIWGRFADTSSRKVMAAAALLTAVTGAITVTTDRLAAGIAESAWFLPAAYFLLSIAHSGARVGRKTYVVDLGTGNRRTDYVAISNTVIGVALLLLGSLSFASGLIGNAGVIAVFAALGIAGALLSLALREIGDGE